MVKREKIAVLGAGGTMGFPIARNLTAAGFEVAGWNRSKEKAEPLSQDGTTIVDTPKDAARRSSVVLTILADGEAVLEAMDGALGGELGDEPIWLQMSTIGEAATERCNELARERGVAFIDAPVLGTKQPAEEGKLIVLASGPEQLRHRVDPIFEVIGQRTMWLGQAGRGSLLKLAINSWIVAVVEGGAETLALAEGLGIDPELVLEAVSGGPLDLPYLQMKGRAMLERNFEPSFRLALAAKDAALVEEAAARHGLDLPLVATIRRRLDEGAEEHGDEDLAATYLTSALDSAARTR